MSPNDLVSLLNELIETSRDGEMGFLKAAEDTRSASLRAFFAEAAKRCGTGAQELQNIVAGLGGTAETGGTVKAALHRGWLSLKEAVMSRDDLAILEECERGEDFAKNKYANVLARELPEWVRTVVQRQYDGVRANHDQVRALRDDQ